MNGYIYNVDSNEIVLVIEGESNEQIESEADSRGYMGADEFGLVYSSSELTETEHTEYVKC